MKRILILLILAAFSIVLYSQSAEKAKKLSREEKKTLRKAEAEAAFFEAKTALNNRDFVLEAILILGEKGRSQPVVRNINFISMTEGRFYIQLVPETNFGPGPNGLGGITLKARPSTYEINEDKRGNINLKIVASGNSGTFEVILNLTKGGRNATAKVGVMTTGSRVTYKGEIFSTENSVIYRSGFEF